MRAPVDSPLHEQTMRNHPSDATVVPNPVADILNIKGILGDKISFVIYDEMGKMVKIGTIFAPHQINVANLYPGTYILRLYNGESFEYIKFLKE